MGRSTTPSRTALRLAATAGGLALVATVLGGGTASAQEPDGGTPGGDTVITSDGVEVPVSDNGLIRGVQEALLDPPGPNALYTDQLANPNAGNSTGAFGPVFGPVFGAVLDQLAPEPEPCTDNVCGPSQSDLVGP